MPILHEFKPQQVHDIVNHSDARLLFVGDVAWEELNAEEMPHLEGIVYIPDFSLCVSRSERLTEARENLNRFFGEKYPKYFRPEHVEYHKAEAEELALINYTSGTTSNSKGVLLPYRALWSNVEFGKEKLGAILKKGDNNISMLPMAHFGIVGQFAFPLRQFLHAVAAGGVAGGADACSPPNQTRPCPLR